MSLDDMMKLGAYSLARAEKRKMLDDILYSLTLYHAHHCLEYNRILQAFSYQSQNRYAIEQLPFLPVRLFKEYDLYSVASDKIVKTMTSSGTSGQAVAKIYLDDENTRNQMRVLSQIIASFIGKKRLPMLILDTALVKKDRSIFSARGAGIVGFSMFGRDVFYALDDDMKFDMEGVQAFIQKHRETPVILFGYTYMIWQYVIKALRASGTCLNISQGFLFHVGGWKKLESERVDSFVYNQLVTETMGNVRVHNYYGMAEQLGSIFVECEYGVKHCSIFSDIIIRRAHDFSCAEFGQRGLMELVSVLPTSYPGHVLLTEDEGEIVGEDDCPCGRLGKTFKIHGRIKNAEVRGCSDTYEQRS